MNAAGMMAAVAANQVLNEQKREAAGPGFGPPPRGPFWYDLIVGLGLAVLFISGMMLLMALVNK